MHINDTGMNYFSVNRHSRDRGRAATNVSVNFISRNFRRPPPSALSARVNAAPWTYATSSTVNGERASFTFYDYYITLTCFE